MPILIALLRAIGPATHTKMSMAALREACHAAGLERVETYIQTGNLIVGTRKSAATVEATLIRVLGGFGLDNEVFVRRLEELAAIVDANPFPEAAVARPGALVMCFLAGEPGREVLAKLAEYRGPERFKLIRGELCVDCAEGVTGSKLMPQAIERRLAVRATARNWNTVRKLLEKARKFQGMRLPG